MMVRGAVLVVETVILVVVDMLDDALNFEPNFTVFTNNKNFSRCAQVPNLQALLT